MYFLHKMPGMLLFSACPGSMATLGLWTVDHSWRVRLSGVGISEGTDPPELLFKKGVFPVMGLDVGNRGLNRG
jgi:hypothetical protein